LIKKSNKILRKIIILFLFFKEKIECIFKKKYFIYNSKMEKIISLKGINNGRQFIDITMFSKGFLTYNDIEVGNYIYKKEKVSDLENGVYFVVRGFNFTIDNNNYNIICAGSYPYIQNDVNVFPITSIIINKKIHKLKGYLNVVKFDENIRIYNIIFYDTKIKQDFNDNLKFLVSNKTSVINNNIEYLYFNLYQNNSNVGYLHVKIESDLLGNYLTFCSLNFIILGKAYIFTASGLTSNLNITDIILCKKSNKLYLNNHEIPITGFLLN
jgi:hypothetical protein